MGIPQALRNSRQLAQSAEAWGYKRYWIAEHHNLDGVASSATVVMMGHIADHTKSIRVGSGGIMLPNHAPLVVAEQFGTLATLYPGRIDLGLGRAPGTDQLTARALRHSRAKPRPTPSIGKNSLASGMGCRIMSPSAASRRPGDRRSEWSRACRIRARVSGVARAGE